VDAVYVLIARSGWLEYLLVFSTSASEWTCLYRGPLENVSAKFHFGPYWCNVSTV